MNPEELFDTHYHIAKETLHRMFNNPHAIARQHRIEFEDLLQYARTGLWRACISWQPDKSKFMSHAINHIKWHVIERLKRETSIIRYTINKKFDANEKYELVSIDADYMEDSDGHNTYHDVIPSESNIDVLDDVIGNIESNHIFSQLTDKQKSVIKLKLKGLTSGDIGKILNMTPSNVREHCNKAKKKLEKTCNYTSVRKQSKGSKKEGRKVCIEGKMYSRILDASAELNIQQNKIVYRLQSNSSKFKEWYYVS